MCQLCTCLLVLTVPAISAGDPALQEARVRLLRGNYGEARLLYAELAKKTGLEATAAIGIGRAWQAEGEYDQALAAIDTALKKHAKHAGLLAARAELLYLRGRWAEAEKAAKEAGEESFLARWVLARIYRDRGDFTKASTELVSFIRAYNQKEITDTEELLLIGLAACERARWDPRLQDQFQFVLDDLWSAANKSDKDFWPAEYHIGRLYLEKYNEKRASRSFDNALKINPRAAEVLVARGESALQGYQVKDAEEFATRALKINPRLPEALRLKADIHLLSGNTSEALNVLETARGVNPREEETLARIAACYSIDRKEAQLAELVKEVEKQNPKAGLFYSELGQRLEERKYYDEAEKHYKKAIALRPALTTPRNQLGLLYMRLGKEEEARPLLEKAADNDEFNVRVFNTLKVLKHLDNYPTIKTAHFHLRYDPKNDKVLGSFVAKYLEDLYKEYSVLFDYRPEGPFLIEVFNRHDMFSGRVVALPDLHTIGACTGRVVAMVSPRDQAKIIAKPFNWNRVLRHELVHVFNLEQTNFRVPHWFTEGLAVSLEGYPMPPQWYELLKRRVASGELMNLDNILLGFVRPASGEEWQLAYLQSYLYVDYLKKLHGKQVVGAFLKAYADGLDTDAALEKICKIPKEQFEKNYRKHLEELATKVAGKPAEKVLSFRELREAVAKNPTNLSLAARLAEQYLLVNDYKEVRKLLDPVLEMDVKHGLANYVMARLLLAEKKPAEAQRMLERTLDAKPPEPKALRLLGKLQFESKSFESAARTLELGRKAEPHDAEWLVELAKVYNQTKDEAKLIGVLKDLAPTNADDLDTRRELSKMLSKAGQHVEAERYAREALEIDVNDEEAQRVLLSALEAQSKTEQLKELRQLLGK